MPGRTSRDPATGRPEPAVADAIAALQRLAELVAERRAQLAREAGLSEPQWRALERIAAPGFLPSLFARAEETTPAAVSKLLRQLLEKDLVTVSVSGEDARQRVYAPTARGRRVLARIEAARREAVEAVWAGVSARDLRRFTELAEELAGRLEAFARAHR